LTGLGKSSEPTWRGTADPGRLDYLRSLYDCAADFLEHGQRDEAVGSLTECLAGLYELLIPPYDLITRCNVSFNYVILIDTSFKTYVQQVPLFKLF
jgi:hypothetical protein